MGLGEAPPQLCVVVCHCWCTQAKQAAFCSPPCCTRVPFAVALPSGRFEKRRAGGCSLGSAGSSALVQSLFQRQERQLPLLPLGMQANSSYCQEASLMLCRNYFFLWFHPVAPDLSQAHSFVSPASWQCMKHVNDLNAHLRVLVMWDPVCILILVAFPCEAGISAPESFFFCLVYANYIVKQVISSSKWEVLSVLQNGWR